MGFAQLIILTRLLFNSFQCSLNDFSTDGYLEARDAKRMDAFIQYGMVAGIQAMRDSGLEITEENQDRVGCNAGRHRRYWAHREDVLNTQ